MNTGLPWADFVSRTESYRFIYYISSLKDNGNLSLIQIFEIFFFLWTHDTFFRLGVRHYIDFVVNLQSLI